MSQFFISYAHGDDDSVRLRTYLADELRKAGHEVFTDQKIEDGEKFGAAITKQVEACDCFVLLLSKAAVASNWVLAEVESAEERIKKEKKPIIYVVRLCDVKLNVQWRALIGQVQHRKWAADADSERVLNGILGRVTSDAAETTRRQRLLLAGILAAAALMIAALAYLFVVAPRTNLEKLLAADSLSRAKECRNGASRPGWSSRADAAYAQFLAHWSDRRLAEAKTNLAQGDVPKALVLAALVAQEHGGKVDDLFRGVYEEGNYASLKQTLRTGSALGAGLAVSSDGTQVAAGNTLWNLTARKRCSLATGAINVVAFGPLGLYTGGNEEVIQWTNCGAGAQIPVNDERVQDLAVAQDGTVAVVVRKGRDVLLHKGLTELSLPHAEPVHSVAFADDRSFLVTTSGKLLSVWSGTLSAHHPPPIEIDTGLSLQGAVLNGDYVAVYGSQKVKIWRLRPAVQFIREVPPPAPVRSIALSEDAVLLAMVSEEGVFSDRVARVASRRIGVRQSVTSDVVFSDVRRQLIVKRADAVELWDAEPSSADADDPEQRLGRWMEKFALTVDENGLIAPRLWSENR